MKLKSLALWLTMGVMTCSTGVYAKHHHSSSSLSSSSLVSLLELEGIQAAIEGEFLVIFGALRTDFVYGGSTSNPNPGTNTFYNALIAANDDIITDAISSIAVLMNSIGIPVLVTDTISDQIEAYEEAAVAYSLTVQQHASAPTQLAAYNDLFTAANALGMSLSSLANGNPMPYTTLLTITSILTEAAQACDGVLTLPNSFNATPGTPSTEATACVDAFASIRLLIEGGGII